MNKQFVTGFTKRAKQHGLAKDQINLLIEKSAISMNGVMGGVMDGITSAHNYVKPHFQSAQKGMSGPYQKYVQPAVDFGKREILQPMKDIPKNYQSMIQNHQLAGSMANDPFEAQAHEQEARQNLLNLLRGVGTGTGAKLVGTAGALGVGKALYGQPQQPQQQQPVQQ